MSFLQLHLHLHRCLLESTCASAAAICAISTENRKPHFAGRVMLCALKSMIETDCTVQWLADSGNLGSIPGTTFEPSLVFCPQSFASPPPGSYVRLRGCRYQMYSAFSYPCALRQPPHSDFWLCRDSSRSTTEPDDLTIVCNSYNCR
jgi:hypothetical protein